MANLVDLTGVAMVTDRATLVDFDWRFNDKQARAACLDLHILKFTDKEANALIIGESGTGERHVAKAVAYQTTLSSQPAGLSRTEHC